MRMIKTRICAAVEEAVCVLALREAELQGCAAQQLPALAPRLRHAVNGLEQHEDVPWRYFRAFRGTCVHVFLERAPQVCLFHVGHCRGHVWVGGEDGEYQAQDDYREYRRERLVVVLSLDPPTTSRTLNLSSVPSALNFTLKIALRLSRGFMKASCLMDL